MVKNLDRLFSVLVAVGAPGALLGLFLRNDAIFYPSIYLLIGSAIVGGAAILTDVFSG